MELDYLKIVEAEKSGLNWLIHSYTKHGTGGFPHSRWMYLPSKISWGKDYAETTGYLIENLFRGNTLNKISLEVAILAGKWLLNIQNPEGYYCSGVKFNKPSVFNTAQVLFGLNQLYKYSQDSKYLEAIFKSYNWLISNKRSKGIWDIGLYKDHYFSCYYSRAIWPMISIDQQYFNSKNIENLKWTLDQLFSKKNSQGYFNESGFYPDKNVLSHNIAYTLEGFFESGLLLQDENIIQYIIFSLQILCKYIKENGKTAGLYNNNLSGDYSFVCVTGEAQICSLLLKVYRVTNQIIFKETAELLFKNLLNYQIHSDSPEHHGAFPSSIPIWKNYFPFRYTNWTVKFFLDACWEMKKTLDAPI